MNTELLRTFVAVASEGGFSRAGRALGIGQSTVSLHVKLLEEQAGARLLDRAGRAGGRVRPTPTGSVLLSHARRLLAAEAELFAAVRAEEAGGRGRVVIAASTVPADYLLPPLLAGFLSAHPEVRVVVEVSDSRGAETALLAEACDLAVVGAPIGDKRVRSTRLASDEVVLAGPTRGPHAGVTATSRRGLARLPLILREAGSGTQQAIARLLPAGSDGAVLGRLQLGSTEAVRRSVRAGLGFAFLSRTAIAADLEAGELQVVKLPGTPVRRAFWVARLRTVTPSAAARALLQALSA
jgi:DNA-binding transcriptional LysR family regulator